MSFLHNLQLFDLEVYNQKIKDYLFGININDIIRQRWVSQSWSDFIQWYKGGLVTFYLQKGLCL